MLRQSRSAGSKTIDFFVMLPAMSIPSLIYSLELLCPTYKNFSLINGNSSRHKKMVVAARLHHFSALFRGPRYQTDNIH